MHPAKFILAKEMLNIGFQFRIISQETALSKKVVCRLAKRVLDVEVLPNYQHRPGKEPTGAAIVKNISSKRHASVAMAIYVAISGEAAHSKFDFKALRTAYRIYVKELSKIKEIPLFDINQIWYLVKELREKLATIETCDRCDCRYFHSINQRMGIGCPFCFAKK